MPVFGNEAMRECEIKLLAYLIGDGGLTGGSIRFTTANLAIERDFTEAVAEFGGCVCTPYRSETRAPSFAVVADPDQVAHLRQRKAAPEPEAFGRSCHVLQVEPSEPAPFGLQAARHNAPNRMMLWLRELGLAGKGVGHKAIPSCVFRLPRPQLALFLRHLFATDGWATVLASGPSQLGYSTICERLAHQVSHLLLRFGVIAKRRQRWVRYLGARRPAWQLDITDAGSIRRFVDEIGIFGKESVVARAAEAISQRRLQTNTDLIPKVIWKHLERAKGAMSWSELANRAGVASFNDHVGQRALSRGRLARLAMALDDGSLLSLANSDVYWDRIESIVPMGARQVYDLTIPGTHNFIANDVCVHNTSFALNIAENAAIRFGHPVAVLSLEMSKEQLALRLLCSQTEVPLYKVRSGNLSDAEFQRIPRKLRELYAAPVQIDDTASPTVLEIRAKCRRLKAEKRLDLVLIDYLQLIRASGGYENRVQEISHISRALKALAKELDVPVIALSQLSRAVEQRTGKDRRPQLSDLRESGALEQDADLVMFVYREEMYNRTDPKLRGKAEIIISKQRNGPTGDVPLTFRHEFTQFVPYSPIMEGETDRDAPPEDFSPF
jgi:replicative DNA helicase